MVATQNIDTLGPIWIFSLRGGVLTFVASGLDINGCVQIISLIKTFCNLTDIFNIF